VAQRNYLVEGLSGAGKSSVYEELIRRGYWAVSTDRAWKVPLDPGAVRPVGPMRHHSALWDEQRAIGELERPEPDVLFVCGSSGNRDRFRPYFTEIFNLRIDDDTMRRRLRDRTNNDFGKRPEEVELMLRLNRIGERPSGAIDLDATRPLGRVVDELLRAADCEALPAASSLVPWSKRGSAVGRSFVIPESALATVLAAGAAAFGDVLGREAVACSEYGWSGVVLATLVQCLDEHGIDLQDVRRARDGSVIVLTAAHREQYLARLDPATFDGVVLRRYYEQRTETNAQGVEYAMLDGIAFLRDTLEQLDSAAVAVLLLSDDR
jgi:hypothetical protein